MNLCEQKQDKMKLCERMLATPMSSYELADLIGLPRPSVRSYIQELHERKRVHVCEWKMNGKRLTKFFVAGEGVDVDVPVGVCHKPDLEEEIFKRERVVVNVHRMPLVEALFGPYKPREAA